MHHDSKALERVLVIWQAWTVPAFIWCVQQKEFTGHTTLSEGKSKKAVMLARVMCENATVRTSSISLCSTLDIYESYRKPQQCNSTGQEDNASMSRYLNEKTLYSTRKHLCHFWFCRNTPARRLHHRQLRQDQRQALVVAQRHAAPLPRDGEAEAPRQTLGGRAEAAEAPGLALTL